MDTNIFYSPLMIGQNKIERLSVTNKNIFIAFLSIMLGQNKLERLLMTKKSV
jgi:hypothetical protein